MLIDFAAFGLAVGTKLPANIGTFIIFKSKPAQTIKDLLFRAGDGALQVGIFDAENKLSARFFGEQIVIQRGARGAEMHMSRWGGGDAGAGRFVGQRLLLI
jgi:hypothetical protein